MQCQEFIEAVNSEPMWQRGGERAPHKPLAVLFALGRSVHGQRLVRYADAEPTLIDLLERFGPPRRRSHPEQPVWRLRSRDGEQSVIWHLDGHERIRSYSNGDPNISDLRKHASIGLSEAAHALFHGNAAVARLVAERIAEYLVPDTLHEDLLESIGLADVESAERPREGASGALALDVSPRERILAERSRRSASFARRVLEAYDYRCAICAASPKMDTRHFGLEAAHIRWVQANGPDHVTNGLCLCRMHHVALDRGAVTLGTDLKVEISSRLVLDGSTRAMFEPFHGRTMNLPRTALENPHPDAITWHRREVFRV